MNVDSFLLSEYAAVDPAGRLTIVNVFNRLQGPGPKWLLPMMYLSSVIHAHRNEAGRHHGEIRLLNSKREQIMPDPLRFDFELTLDQVHPGMPLRHGGVYQMGGLVFNAPGAYAFELHIDETYAAATTFYVLKLDQKPPGRRG